MSELVGCPKYIFLIQWSLVIPDTINQEDSLSTDQVIVLGEQNI
jgi:hypothetical protein